MSRKNQQRKQASRAAQPLPYRWTLPEEIQGVKQMATVQAHICAYLVLSQHLDYTEMQTHAMAVTSCLDQEAAVVDGTQGTNDSALYRETFIETFRQEYPGAYNALKQSPSLSLPTLET